MITVCVTVCSERCAATDTEVVRRLTLTSFFVRNPSQRKWGEHLPVPAASCNQHCDGQRFLPERPLWSELQRCCSGHDAVRTSGPSQRPWWFPLRRWLQLYPQGPSWRIHPNHTGTQVRSGSCWMTCMIKLELSHFPHRNTVGIWAFDWLEQN